MGSGSWTSKDFESYSSDLGRSVTSSGHVDISSYHNVQDMYKSTQLKDNLDPRNITFRECCDSEEHPNTIAVIFAMDETGSMGRAAMEVSSKINEVMVNLYKQIADIEFCVMGIGDIHYDDAPIQMSQFESDIRIVQSIDDIYFEGGGGGNGYESYSAAWYMAARHTKLDCWKRGKKGIIISTGDEPLNPYLDRRELQEFTGDDLQGDVETSDIFKEVSEKYEVYHIFVDHNHSRDFYFEDAQRSFSKYLGDNFKVASINEISQTIIDCIMDACKKMEISTKPTITNDEESEVTNNDTSPFVMNTISW